jgi:hypothetical protein
MKLVTIKGHRLTINWSDLLLICVCEEMANGFAIALQFCLGSARRYGCCTPAPG